jgi:hypothetical protein
LGSWHAGRPLLMLCLHMSSDGPGVAVKSEQWPRGIFHLDCVQAVTKGAAFSASWQRQAVC